MATRLARAPSRLLSASVKGDGTRKRQGTSSPRCFKFVNQGHGQRQITMVAPGDDGVKCGKWDVIVALDMSPWKVLKRVHIRRQSTYFIVGGDEYVRQRHRISPTRPHTTGRRYAPGRSPDRRCRTAAASSRSTPTVVSQPMQLSVTLWP